MKKSVILFSLLSLLWFSGSNFAYQATDKGIGKEVIMDRQAMDQQAMERVVKTMATAAKGEKGFVEFTFNNQRMYLISDTSHDRMRIITPVAEYNKLTPTHLHAVLESNFHKALDARYAVSEGVLYAVFIHPLSALNAHQVKSAVHQVANLALSFGTEYSSGVLDFGGGQ